MFVHLYILAYILTHTFSFVVVNQGNLAFGSKGRPASAGKPRIPSDATIVFQVEMVGLPGREPELIELIGD
jgi:peptidylprolyl isomerase